MRRLRKLLNNTPAANSREFRLAKQGKGNLHVQLITEPSPWEVKILAKEAYCVKCKAKKMMKDEEAITMKNGRPATKGTCPDCGTKMFKIGK